MRYMVDDAVESLLTDAGKLVIEGDERGAVRTIMDRTDYWMQANDFDVCSVLLQKADPESLGVTTSIGLLAALDPARGRTRRARDKFIARFREYLLRTHTGDAEELMRGIR